MYYCKNIEEIIKELNTNIDGLDNMEAKERLKQNGKNEIPKPPSRTVLKIFIEQFLSPIIIILIVVAILSLITKSYSDSIFIFLVITINAIIGTYQEWNSEKSAEKLQEMIKLKAKVVRNGKEIEINSDSVVIGDILSIESGDKVAADIRLIETKNLSIDESILTGESKAKNKDEKINEDGTILAERTNIAYAGTIVTKGRGKGIVIKIGKDTEFGKIADKVLTSDEEKSPLIIMIEKFIKQISIGFIILAIILSILLYIKGYYISEIFQNIVALTVSSIPEGLTIAMTIALSISSKKMAKKNVIVKKLNTVESLGSCNVIATDKTGTLTANEQTAKKIILPNGKMAYIKGIGYNDIGEVIFDKDISMQSENIIKEIAKLGMLNNEAALRVEDGKWVYHGDAIDIAFLALGLKMKLKKNQEILDIFPYESKHKYSAVSFKDDNDKIYSTIKGATEKVLEFCKYMEIDEKKYKIDKNSIIAQSEELAKQGFRIIAIAKKENHNTNRITLKDMTFLGLVAFTDPIRNDVEETIQICNKAGIDVVMITGDHPITANAIGKRIGINDIYARVSPLEKLEIVEKLKNEEKFVAVTGDGVNDTPALKAANIGIAMGNGTDIAKETADMIITDNNFSSIIEGIKEGRKAYNNIRKVIYLLLSTGFSEVILYILSIIFNLPIPLTAIQLLWLNLISNGVQGDMLAFETDMEDVMKKKVKNNKETIMNKLLISEIIISSIVMTLIEFIFYIYLLKFTNIDIITVRTYMLTLMIFIENIHIFNCRSESISCFKIPGTNNMFLIFSIIITCLIQIMIIRIPLIANFFELTTLEVDYILPLFILTIPVILVMEIFKIYNRKREKIKGNI